MKWTMPLCRWTLHSWEVTAVNPCHMELEQQCRHCLKFRHKIPRADLSLPSRWTDGELPSASLLRKQGKLESDGFQWWGREIIRFAT